MPADSMVSAFEGGSPMFAQLAIRRLATAIAPAAAAVLAAALLAPPAGAVDRVLVPQDSPGGPFYARIEQGLVHMTDDWVAVAFYRDPDCVDPGFDLLAFFDFDRIPEIFDCALTVHGFELWDGGQAPRQSRLFGNGAVPVWFFSVTDYEAALPGLTLDEIQAMPSLVRGSAQAFEETLHPVGGARQTMLQLSAKGWLEDGRGFRYRAAEAGGTIRQVQIDFD
jgi:hypothetical protein